MSRIIDLHFHLDYYKDYYKNYEYINKHKIYTLCMTNMPELYENNINTFKTTEYIKFALGFHPQFAGEEKFNYKLFDKYLDSTKYIGEVGLDYSKKYINSKEIQRKIFEYICSKISGKGKIVSIHSRNSESDVLDILIKYKVEFAIFHWYSGGLGLLEKIVNNGYYFSINYSMTKSKKGINIIKCLPLDRILVESDGPFTKVDGQVSSPENLDKVYNNLDEILSINSKEIVFNNFKQILYNSLDYDSNK